MLIFEQGFSRVYHSLGFSPKYFTAGRTSILPSLRHRVGGRGTKIPWSVDHTLALLHPPLGAPIWGGQGQLGGSWTKHHPQEHKCLYLGVSYPL